MEGTPDTEAEVPAADTIPPASSNTPAEPHPVSVASLGALRANINLLRAAEAEDDGADPQESGGNAVAATTPPVVEDDYELGGIPASLLESIEALGNIPPHSDAELTAAPSGMNDPQPPDFGEITLQPVTSEADLSFEEVEEVVDPREVAGFLLDRLVLDLPLHDIHDRVAQILDGILDEVVLGHEARMERETDLLARGMEVTSSEDIIQVPVTARGDSDIAEEGGNLAIPMPPVTPIDVQSLSLESESDY